MFALWLFKSIGELHSFEELLKATNHLDVGWYQFIATNGYSLNPEITDGQSTVFFPLFPALAAPLIHLAGVEPLMALNIVQKLFLLGLGPLIYKWAKGEGFHPKESLTVLLLHPALVFFYGALYGVALRFLSFHSVSFLEAAKHGWSFFLCARLIALQANRSFSSSDCRPHPCDFCAPVVGTHAPIQPSHAPNLQGSLCKHRISKSLALVHCCWAWLPLCPWLRSTHHACECG